MFNVTFGVLGLAPCHFWCDLFPTAVYTWENLRFCAGQDSQSSGNGMQNLAFLAQPRAFCFFWKNENNTWSPWLRLLTFSHILSSHGQHSNLKQSAGMFRNLLLEFLERRKFYFPGLWYCGRRGGLSMQQVGEWKGVWHKWIGCLGRVGCSQIYILHRILTLNHNEL